MLETSVNFSVTPIESSRIKEVDWDNLPFGKVFSDHMLIMEFHDGEWKSPSIMPFGPIQFHPATSSIHYGQSIFEGIKANKSPNGDILIFRPNMNAERFAKSCERMCMPVIPSDLFVECVRKIVEIDSNWIPDKPNFSLYIRPFMFSTDEFVGIKPSESYKFIIFTCPVGAYYSEPVNVLIEEHFTRAAEGGVGRAKAAGNYGASLYPAKQGQMKGYHQLVWTDAKTHTFIEESGTMNIVFGIDNKIISPTEESDTILRGITKRSVLDVAKSWGYEVEERKVLVSEVIEAIKNGSCTEVFGAGTAATIAPIAKIGFRGDDYILPDIKTRTFSNRISLYMNDLKCGRIEDTFNWLLKV